MLQVAARQDRMQSWLTVTAASSAWDAARAVALTSVEAFAAAEDFPRFAHALLAAAASCSGRVILTRGGKANLDVASQLTHFRLAVIERKWSEAKRLADQLQVISGLIHPIPSHPTLFSIFSICSTPHLWAQAGSGFDAGRWGPELDAFALFLEQWIACRYLEFAMSTCTLPAVLGKLPWLSLHNGPA